MPTATDIVKCKICGEEVLWGELRRHKVTEHNYTSSYRRKQQSTDPTETFRQIKQLAKDMMIQIDDERNKIQQRLIELDNMAAKYKPLL